MAQLTEQQVALYRAEGWIVPDYRVPGELLRDARSRATAMMDARPEYRDLYPDLLGADIAFIEAPDHVRVELIQQVGG